MGNKVVHFEVTGKDGTALQKFYSGLFDWKLDTNNPDNYGMVDTGVEGAIGGGIGQAPEGSAGLVTFYVETNDINRCLKEAESLGGSIVMPRTEMGVVTIGMFSDPEGHVVGLVES